MLSFKDIESLVQAQHRTLLSANPSLANAVRLYKNGGRSHWSTAGMYAYVDSDKRLVFEAMYLERYDACVIRVFHEQPLRFLYQRKAVGDISKCTPKIRDGMENFHLHLPQRRLLIAEQDAGTEWPEMDRVLLPIPPPCTVAEIPE
jgi:hypothetical protein